VPRHLISIGQDVDLDLPSKLDRSPAFLGALMDHGREQADEFLERHAGATD
jgi:NTE family protein